MKETQLPWASCWPERKRMLTRIRDLARSTGVPIDLSELAELSLIELEAIVEELKVRDFWDELDEIEDREHKK